MKRIGLIIGIILMIVACTFLFLVGVGLNLWGALPYVIGIVLLIIGAIIVVINDQITGGKYFRKEEKNIRDESIKNMKENLKENLKHDKEIRDKMLKNNHQKR